VKGAKEGVLIGAAHARTVSRGPASRAAPR
jgi:hypothetical protein